MKFQVHYDFESFLLLTLYYPWHNNKVNIYNKNSDLQAGIWFGSMALSPIIPLPAFHYGLVVFALKVVSYTCMRLLNATYICFHQVKFYFHVREPIAFPVWGQLNCDCQNEE